jgi:hypothetical protein
MLSNNVGVVDVACAVGLPVSSRFLIARMTALTTGREPGDLRPGHASAMRAGASRTKRRIVIESRRQIGCLKELLDEWLAAGWSCLEVMAPHSSIADEQS